MSRPPARLSVQLAAVTCLVVAFAVAVAGAVAVGLVRDAYDGQARAVLRRNAELVAELAGAGQAGSTQPARPAGRLLSGTGVTVVRVRADGVTPRLPDSLAPAAVRLPAADRAAVAAGRAVSATRTLDGTRYLVATAPVTAANGSPAGGVALLQPVSAARAVSDTVVRRLAVALAAGLAAAVLVAVAVARRVARPLVQAAAAAQRLAAGDRDVRLESTGPAEVADVAASISALASALAASEARQRDFLLSVSHEFRTPLTGIRGFAEALSDEVLTGPDAAAAGRTIAGEAGRLQRLVDDLLALARLEADDFALDVVEVDLTELVRSAAVAWGPRCAAAGIPFRLDVPPGPLAVRTDPVRLRQVVDGLVDNAVRVTPPGRPLVLTAAGPASRVVLQVRDGGPGLTDEDLAVAFDRSALASRYRGERRVGVGIGLSLIGRLVERLGGTVSAFHAPEGGAAFTVTLPRALPVPATVPPAPAG